MRSNLLVKSFKRALQATSKCDCMRLEKQTSCRTLSSAIENEFGNDHDHQPTIATDVKVTRTTSMSKSASLTSSPSLASTSTDTSTSTLSDDTALVDSLLSKTSTLIERSGSNIIAFSGGVDSSLAAALVYRVFHNYRDSASASSSTDLVNLKAVIGVSPSLPQRQLDLARSIAAQIGIDLMEVRTTEGSDATYIANEGKACFICKNHLYAALEAVADTATQLSISNRQGDDGTVKVPVALFNGTNADDTKDPTRLGLRSAESFSVKSPLIEITKDEVRRAAKHLNLSNWNYAASPCLRSRLALGVEATEHHLKAVNMAEEKVRQVLTLDETANLRVRMLAGQRAMVELDKEQLMTIHHDDGHESVEDMLRREGFEEFCRDLGFFGGVGVRAFKTGSVSIKER